MTPNSPGFLIVFEGIDGAGKSTQIKRAEDVLIRNGFTVTRSKEPTDGPWGRKIRESASSHRMSLDDELNAFIQDRTEHVRELIRPALRRGEVVLLDRYYFSTMAYQGSRGANIQSIQDQMRAIAPTPDLVILLDLEPEIGLTRIQAGRGETPNAFENQQNLQAVRDVFRTLAATDATIVVIDATPPADVVHAAVVQALNRGPFANRLRP